MKKQETMRIAVYCRVATEAQLTDQSSEKEQIKRLQQFLNSFFSLRRVFPTTTS